MARAWLRAFRSHANSSMSARAAPHRRNWYCWHHLANCPKPSFYACRVRPASPARKPATGTVAAMASDHPSPMPTARLGAGGPVVPRIGLGLAALARPAYITGGREDDLPDRSVAGLRAQTFSVLDAAYTAGVRYVDVARSYGRAEEFLAGWLAERGHRDVVVGSKWGYRYTGGWRLDAGSAGGQGAFSGHVQGPAGREPGSAG